MREQRASERRVIAETRRLVAAEPFLRADLRDEVVAETLLELTEWVADGVVLGSVDGEALRKLVRTARERVRKRDYRLHARRADLDAPFEGGGLRREAATPESTTGALAADAALTDCVASAALVGALARTPANRALDTGLVLAAALGLVEGDPDARRRVGQLAALVTGVTPPRWLVEDAADDRLARRRSRARPLAAVVCDASTGRRALAVGWPNFASATAQVRALFLAVGETWTGSAATLLAVYRVTRAAEALAPAGGGHGIAAVALRLLDGHEPWETLAPLVATLSAPWGARRDAFAALRALAAATGPGGAARKPFRALRAAARRAGYGVTPLVLFALAGAHAAHARAELEEGATGPFPEAEYRWLRTYLGCLPTTAPSSAAQRTVAGAHG